MAYKKGVIAIPNVSGNIAITVTTALKPIVNLFQKTPSKQSTSTAEVPGDTVYLGARLNSSHNAVYQADDQLVTRPIPATKGDVFHITTDKANNSNNYKGTAWYYDANGNYINECTRQYYEDTLWSWDSGYLNGTLRVEDYPSYSLDVTDVAYVRFCLAYTDIDNIVISKE